MPFKPIKSVAIDDLLSTNEESLNDVEVKKTPTLRTNGRPSRDGVSQDLYQSMLSTPIQPGQQPLHYHRFRVYIVLARHTGLRVIDVGRFTKQMIESLLSGRQIDVQERKNRRYRRIVFSEAGIKDLMLVKDSVEFVYSRQTDLMGTEYSRNWSRFVNSTLKRHTKDSDDYIRSHSFRISYITFFY